MSQTKPIEISKYEVEEAYKRVKANKGSAGIDRQSLQDFEQDKSNNLYKLWNRLSSGSYMPPPVLRVEIPKGDGGIRKLGIPAITDRIAQMVVKQRIEPEMEQHFHPNSYGYRPNKSALELTNGFQKKTQKTPKSEILLSEQRKQDYLERNSNE